MKTFTRTIALALVAGLIGCGGGGIETTPRITAKPKPGKTGDNVAKTTGGNGKKNGGSGPGTLAGVIKYGGTAPAPGLPAGYQNKDKYCTANKAKIKDESLVVGPGGGVANVIVFIERAPKGYTAPPVPKKPVIFDQHFCTFVPHVLAIRADQQLELRNGDNTTHNTHITPLSNQEYNKSLGPNGQDFYKYTQRESVPVKVKCDIHGWMSAYHLPLDHGLVFVTKDDGKFTLAGIPAGTHKINIWHEKAGWIVRRKSVTINAGETTPLNLTVEPAKFATYHGERPKVIVLSQLSGR